MRRDLKVLMLVLTLPLMLYFVGYAYAAVTTSTYVVKASGVIAPDMYGTITAYAEPGDFVTGGGFKPLPGMGSATAWQSYPVYTPGSPPVGWAVYFINTTPYWASVEVYAVCMTPVTVAGIGVPEFASLYMAIALAACIYFALTRIRKPSLK